MGAFSLALGNGCIDGSFSCSGRNGRPVARVEFVLRYLAVRFSYGVKRT